MYVLSNRVTTKNAAVSGELTGVVIEIGDNVTRFKPGDRVVSLCLGHFGTYEVVPERACFTLNNDEDDAVCPRWVLLAFSIQANDFFRPFRQYQLLI